MRIDKFLWTVRLYKTRSLATKACDSGKVLVNGAEIKPSKVLKTGDQFSIRREAGTVFTYKVEDFPVNRVGAPLVQQYITDNTAPEEVEKLKQYHLAQKEYRVHGLGKPSKKDKRNIRRFLGY
jgi:ribosome-associated heat shock protein Hsp15